MKVLMLSDLYPPVVGGGERHVQSLSRELAKRGHEVSVCTIGHQSLPKYEEEDGVKVYRLEGIFQRIPFLFRDATRRWHPPTSDWLVTKKLEQILFEHKPDIIHAHGRIVYSMFPLKNKLDIPLVVTLHGYWAFCLTAALMKGNVVCNSPLTKDCISCGRESYGVAKCLAVYLGTRLNRSKLKLVDKFIAVSYFVKEVHLKYLELRDKDIVVIPNFFAPEVNVETIGAISLPQDYILFVGALIPVKGINVLIEAYEKLHTKTKLVLIGTSHPHYHYRGTENILIMENVPRHVVIQAYKNCRFAIFPSIFPEPFGTVVLEAMSHKKAVITPSIGGFIDMVADGETGILVPPNDAEALSNAIRYLLENPQIAQDLGQKGYEHWKQNFTAEAVVPRIAELYQSMV